MSKKRGEITKQILLLLLAGALTTSPRASQRIWGEIFRLCFGAQKKLPPATTAGMVRRRFHYLKSAQLVSWKELPDGAVRLELTKAGERKALEYKLEDMQIKKPPHWDRKWRLVIFDVPESMRRARNALRWKLRDLGFLQLQKSVWIHPFPCTDEIDFIAQVFQVDRYLFVAEAVIKPDHVLREWFNLP